MELLVYCYVKQKPSRLDSILQFLNTSDSLTPSDVVKYVMDQPDFHEFGLNVKEMVG